MRRMALLVVGLAAVASPLLAQTSPAPAAPATGTTSVTAPPLTQDVTPSPDDSRLVRAAKLAVARRRALLASGAVWHVDDSMVGHKIDKPEPGNAGQPLGSGGASSKPATGGSAQTMSTAAPGPSKAALAQKKAALKQEQARMGEEADQPYAGDVPEGKAEQRLTEIPGQIKSVDQKMQPPPSSATTSTNPPQ